MKAAIFDVDGTLVDSVELHAKAWQDAFEEFGHELAFDAIRSQIGKGGDQLMPVFLSEQELAAKGKEIEKYRGEVFKAKYFSQVRPLADVRQLFQRLIDGGWKIALASSAKGEELQTYKDIARISDLLDTETSSDDADKSKPHPDIFLAAMDRLGRAVAPQDCVVIGDSPYDAEAAGKAGARASVGVLSGGFPEADLRKAGCVEIYRDPADLLRNYKKSIFDKDK